MANTLFAGIPADGGGNSPLEADLYGAELQSTDAENISATGNLNIGNVINYDAHAQRQTEGGAVQEKSSKQASIPEQEMASDGLITNSSAQAQGRSVNYAGDSYVGNSGYTENNAAPAQSTVNNAAAASAPVSQTSLGRDGQDGSNAMAASGGGEVTNYIPTGSGGPVGGNVISNSYNTTNITTNNYNENYYNNTQIFNSQNNGPINIDTVINTIVGGNGEDQIAIIIQNTLNQVTNLINGGNGDSSIILSIVQETLTQVNTILETTLNNPVLSTLVNDVSATLTHVTNLLTTTEGTINVPDILANVSTLVTDAGALLQNLGGNSIVPALLGELGDTLNQIVNLLGQNDGDIPLDLVGDILDTALSDVNALVTNILGGDGNLLGDIVEAVGGVVNTLGDTLEQTVGGAVGGIGNVLTSVGGDLPVLGALGGNLQDIPATLSTTVGQTVESIVQTIPALLHDVGSDVELLVGQATGTLEQTVESIVHEVSNVLDTVGADLPIIGALGDGLQGLPANLGSVLGDGSPLLDIHGGILSSPVGVADDNALVNVDLGLLSPAGSTPQAAGLGIVDVDASILSTPGSGGDVQDGISAAINLNPVINLVMPDATVPVVNIDIPLPALEQTIPLNASGTDMLQTAIESVTSQTDTLMDQVVSLLDSSPLGSGAVDGGVLFSGGTDSSASTGGGVSVATPLIVLDHIGGSLFGHH